MAGIGFKFRDAVASESGLEAIKGYLFSAVFAAGPWMMTMAVIMALSYFAPPDSGKTDIMFFRASLSYIYAFSLIISGSFQLPVTRYLADKIYEKNNEEIISVFAGSTCFFCVLSAAAGSAFLYFNTAPSALKIIMLMIFITVTLVWNSMSFLSAVKDYKFIIFVFFSGSVFTVLLCVILSKYYFIYGYAIGYLVGQLYIFSGSAFEIIREFNSDTGAKFVFLKYVNKYILLFMGGLFYNIGMWADKIIVWNGPGGETIYGNIKVYGVYDVSYFAACLTIIPAMSYFLVKIETDFYLLYKKYFHLILNRAGLESIEECRDDIIKVVKDSTKSLFKFQALILFAGFIWSVQICSFLKNPKGVEIFQLALAAVLFHVLYLFCTIFMMYFEFYGSYFFTASIFLVLNTLLTGLAINYGITPVTGYLASAFICFVTAFSLVLYNLKYLLYYTFFSQPIIMEMPKNITFDTLKFFAAEKYMNISPVEKYKEVDIDVVEKV